MNRATIEELVELVKHPNPAVRGYSFWALAINHYDNLETIFIKHANDESIVFFMDGCFPMDIPVIEFMRQVVMPNVLDLNCKKLGDSAFAKVALARKASRNESGSN